MTRRVTLAILVTAWFCVGGARAQDGVEFVGTFGSWDVRTAQTPDGQICAARALHPEIRYGDILWAYNTARADSQPVGYLAIDPRLLSSSDGARATVDGEASFSLSQAADGYAYSEPDDDERLFTLMREGLVMVVRLGGAGDEIEVSLLGFTLATNAALAACGTR
ncbi:MAG: hypothetical protein AAFX92_19030 [Pseudomonadota bacterium]